MTEFLMQIYKGNRIFLARLALKTTFFVCKEQLLLEFVICLFKSYHDTLKFTYK